MANQGKRQRTPEDLGWTVELTADSWLDVVQLSRSDVGEHGMFVGADNPPAAGTRVEITLVLPDETVFQLEGVVAFITEPARAGALGRPTGFAVHFDARYHTELAALALMSTSEAELVVPSEPSDVPVELPALLCTESGTRLETVAYCAPLSTFDDAALLTDDSAGASSGNTDYDQSPDSGLTPFPVDPTVLDEAPSPPPADEELALSGLYERPELTPPPARDPRFGDHSSASAVAQPLAPSAVREKRPPVAPPQVPVAARRPATPQVEPIFGIDFGTSYSSIAVVRGDRVVLLEDGDRGTLTPSVVCYADDGELLVGWPAREKALTHPTTTFRSPKRLIGRRYKDKRVEPFLGQTPVRTREGPNGQIVADVYGETIAIPQVCSHLFAHLARVGSEAGFEVRNVLLSAPVGFDGERRAIKRAAELAGLRVVGVIDEPVAAAMSYGLVRSGDGLIAVYDFGGGTFDFSVLEIKGGKSTVIGAAGDDWLGGDDFDAALAEQAANAFWRKHNVDLRKRAVEWERLLMYCERAKRKLSVDKEFDLHVKGIVLSVRGGIDLRMRLDREIFGDLCGGLVERSLEVVSSCLELLELQPTDIDQLVLTGGVTRIPLVRVRVQEYFKQQARLAVNPEHAIVLGNAIYGHLISLRSQQARQPSAP